MNKFELIDSILQKNNGILKTSDVTEAGVSRQYLSEYVKKRGLERVERGLYLSPDAWADGMYMLQGRFPQSVFSHETAGYLLGLAGREPLKYSVTVKSGTNNTMISRLNVKVYNIKEDLFQEGVIEVVSPMGHMVRAYNAERTVCDLIRSRSGIEIQEYQTIIKEYLRKKGKDLPLLMRYAKSFRVEKILKQYLEVLL